MVLAIYQIILHLNKITECLKMTTFKIVFTLDVFFLVLKPQCIAKWHVFYIRNRHISVSSFVYKYDWPVTPWQLHDRKSQNKMDKAKTHTVTISTKYSEPTYCRYWTILFVMLQIYFIYKVAGKKSRRAI
jgi:hypothetical protein